MWWGSVSYAAKLEGNGAFLVPANGGTVKIQNCVKYFCRSNIAHSLCTCQVLLYISPMPRPPKYRPKPLPQSDIPVGRRIARLRKLRGFSQEALSHAMGISRKQVTDYETGKAHLNDEMVIRFALTLKVSTDELLGLKSARPPEEAPTLRLSRRMRELTQLPEAKRRAILKTLDDLIRANS